MILNTLITVISSIVLISSTAVSAEESNKHNSNPFMAKRPYVEVVAKTAKADALWEGATFIAEDSQLESVHQKNQQAVRVNMLARRAF